MKRKIASLALSAAVLSGVFVAPVAANAAPVTNTQQLRNLEINIENSKHHLNAEKNYVVGASNNGNTFDRKAREIYQENEKLEKKINQLSCETDALNELFASTPKNNAKDSKERKATLKTINSKFEKAYFSMRDEKSKLRSSPIFGSKNNSNYREFKDKGTTFKYQVRILDEFKPNYKKLNCNIDAYKFAAKFSKDNVKGLVAQDMNKVNGKLASMKTRADRDAKYNTGFYAERNKRIESHNAKKKANIKKLEDSIKKDQAKHKALKAQMKK